MIRLNAEQRLEFGYFDSNIWYSSYIFTYHLVEFHSNVFAQLNKYTVNIVIKSCVTIQQYTNTTVSDQYKVILNFSVASTLFTWFVFGSYGTACVCPLRSCNIRPRIGIPCFNNFSSKPTWASAFRPRADSAKLILRPWTSSALRISIMNQINLWKMIINNNLKIVRKSHSIVLFLYNNFNTCSTIYLLDTHIHEHHALSLQSLLQPVIQPIGNMEIKIKELWTNTHYW